MDFDSLVKEHVGLSVLYGHGVHLTTIAVIVLVPLFVCIVTGITCIVTTVGASVMANDRAEVIRRVLVLAFCGKFERH